MRLSRQKKFAAARRASQSEARPAGYEAGAGDGTSTAMLNPVPISYIYEPPTDPYLNVIYRDDFILVLDKPSGLLSVPGKDPRLADCLERRAREAFPEARTIHRLDKDTSGIVVMGMQREAHSNISMQFEKRTTKKSYVARVWGQVEGESGQIDLPLATDWLNKPRQRVDYDHGRPAQTEWIVMEREALATRMRLIPHTGRTHQLRVHMMELGHVILGDQFYATGEALAAADRLQLHAEELSFVHPNTGEEVTFVIPCPF
jgi:tRNA pseudouridine32 synthase/23S rRNA pseudouridine746 synthase